MRVLRDVVVHSVEAGEFVVISHEPGIVGERLSITTPQLNAGAHLDVQTTESRPVMIDGAVRHRLRLRVATMCNGVNEAVDASTAG